MFIRRDYARNGFNSRHVEQDLGCVDLIAVDASKCCQINTTCPVFRTAKKIPKTGANNPYHDNKDGEK